MWWVTYDMNTGTNDYYKSFNLYPGVWGYLY